MQADECHEYDCDFSKSLELQRYCDQGSSSSSFFYLHFFLSRRNLKFSKSLHPQARFKPTDPCDRGFQSSRFFPQKTSALLFLISYISSCLLYAKLNYITFLWVWKCFLTKSDVLEVIKARLYVITGKYRNAALFRFCFFFFFQSLLYSSFCKRIIKTAIATCVYLVRRLGPANIIHTLRCERTSPGHDNRVLTFEESVSSLANTLLTHVRTRAATLSHSLFPAPVLNKNAATHFDK